MIYFSNDAVICVSIPTQNILLDTWDACASGTSQWMKKIFFMSKWFRAKILHFIFSSIGGLLFIVIAAFACCSQMTLLFFLQY
jgi:hypothetical protein